MVKFHELRTSRCRVTAAFISGTSADVEFELVFEDTRVAHLPKMVWLPVSRTPCRYLHDPGRIDMGTGAWQLIRHCHQFDINFQKLHVRDTTQPVRGYWSLVLEASQNRSTTFVQAHQVQEWRQAS